MLYFNSIQHKWDMNMNGYDVIDINNNVLLGHPMFADI